MTLDPKEIFADLINFREEIGAKEAHVDITLKPFRFVVYNFLGGAAFHFMPCPAVKKADPQKLHRASHIPDGLSPCGNCITAWNARFPDNKVSAQNFNLERMFSQLQYDPNMWDGVDIDKIKEVNDEKFMPGCYLLYRPVRNMKFHFMKCSDVRYDEKIGWIRAYRFTNNISGKFELFDNTTQSLKPCPKCLAEWNNGEGWNGYSKASEDQQKVISKNFDIREFFMHSRGRPELIELYELMNDNKVWFGADIGNEYPSNWGEISNMYRIANGYRCEQCGVNLSEATDLAIVHHVNGSHPEVGPDNMKVLCVWCHAKQPHHEKSVKIDRDQYDRLMRLWREQGIKRPD
ncbi:MAG: hypothetical protein IJL18_00715 [Synergistaceae bacterium]|nr:hypothetical protein [Synergistaceae bacterium]